MVDYSKIIFKKRGADVRINELAVISRPELVEIGNHVAIDMGVYISVNAKIGDYIHIAPHVCIIGGADAVIIMEDFSGISAGSVLVCASDDFRMGLLGPFTPIEFRHVINKPIILKKYSCVGVNSVVMPGVTLGEGSVIGAGSVVTKNTEPWTVYIGSPAKAVSVRDAKLVLEGVKSLGYEI